MLNAAFLRARQVINRAGLKDAGPLERIPSLLNEVWFAGPYVIRISPEGHSQRLHYESLLATYLPDEVQYPEIVTYGKADFAEWLVVRRVEGLPLSRAWPDMNEKERQKAIEELAGDLRALHEVPASVLGDLVPPFVGQDTLDCPHQLPGSRVSQLLERARGLPGVSPYMLNRALALVEEIGDTLEDSPTGLIHGDLHFENVLWDGSRISAVLDFEWARPGPRDLDLDVILRFCADPFLHVADDYAHLAKRADYREIPNLLRDGYPELFAHPRLHERLTLYSLSYEIRHLLLTPPMKPVPSGETFHPYNRLVRVVENNSYLEWLTW